LFCCSMLKTSRPIQPVHRRYRFWVDLGLPKMPKGPKSLSEKWEMACGSQRDAGPNYTAKIPRRPPFPIFRTDSENIGSYRPWTAGKVVKFG
jgi:hypothetical protein